MDTTAPTQHAVAPAGWAYRAAAPTSFETILLATDLSHASTAATDHAIALAARLGARLLVVNVLDTRHGLSLGSRGGIRPVEEREARSLVAQDLVARARSAGAQATFLIWEGGAGDGIIAAADSEKADLIVMGTRGRGGVERSILGSVSDHVIRHAPCPVLVVRPQDD
jgi:nucleotide-binding universal stress UspA family protein